MCQPKKWWIGLLPLALLLAAMLGVKTSDIESDLANRSSEQLKSAGLEWANASFAGRDGLLKGEAPTPDLKDLAVPATERAWGVRRVSGAGLTVMPEVKPYIVAAIKDGGKVTLSGSYPNTQLKTGVVSALKSAMPNADVVDQMRFGRGASPALAASASFGLAQLARLTKGSLQISDDAISITGQAADVASYDAVLKALDAVPAGIKIAKAEITPPRVSPYTFGVAKAADGAISLSGFAPNAGARDALFAAAQKLGTASGSLGLADGLPDSVNLTAVGAYFYDVLANLKSGSAKLTDTVISVSGEAIDVAAYEKVKALLAAAPSGVGSVTQDIKPPPAVKPYVWSAERTAQGVTLAGLIPSEAARGTILDAAKRIFGAGTVTDQMKLAFGAPDGFLDVVKIGLEQLGKLKAGKFSMSDAALRFDGEGADASLIDGINKAFASLGARFNLTNLLKALPARIAMPTIPTFDPNSPQAICQVKFKEILDKDQIFFATGSARITEESRAVIKILADAVTACPTMTVEVQGHTDSDGDDDANIDLSNRRANAVVEALHNLGVESERMSAKGYGEGYPIAPNDTAEGKAKNRRIEFVVTK